jgi:RNA-binding protein NOB1
MESTSTDPVTTTADSATTATDAGKPIHTLILDAGPLLRNEPPVSSLLAQAQRLLAPPAVLAEVRDAAARARVAATLRPFLALRAPAPASVRAAAEFARRTGDLPALSGADVQVLALAYEVECERNGGDWRLRRVPGQARVNGAPPPRELPRGESATQGSKGVAPQRPQEQREHGELQETRELDEPQEPQAQWEPLTELPQEPTQESPKESLRGPPKESPQELRKVTATVPTTSSASAILLAPPLAQEREQEDQAVTTDCESKGGLRPAVTSATAGPVEAAGAHPSLTAGIENSAERNNEEKGETGRESVGRHDTDADTKEMSKMLGELRVGEEIPAAVSAAHDIQNIQTSSFVENEEDEKDALQVGAGEEKEKAADAQADDRKANCGSDEEESDSEGWITPSNIKRHQAADAAGFTTTTKRSRRRRRAAQPSPSSSLSSPPAVMQVATLTTDFALQNVLLQMNLNLLSPALQRVRHLRTYVLRCHACFAVTRDTARQFCARCGKPALTRVACSTHADSGAVQLHLAAPQRLRWSTRGDRYSIPKPVAGSASGKHSKKGKGGGGGKDGWGQALLLAEDQKEYQRALRQAERERAASDAVDEDYLPGILTGRRSGGGAARPRIGAGKNVNSTRRR